MQRLPGETFEAYKYRRKIDKLNEERVLAGKTIFADPPIFDKWGRVVRKSRPAGSPKRDRKRALKKMGVYGKG
jgi:hypothetical protein